MGNTVVPQPQIAPEPAAPDAQAVQGPAPVAPVSNDQAAAAASAGRRRTAAGAVPPPWRTALSTLLPPEATGPAPTVALQPPPLPDFRRATFKLAVTGVAGANEAQAYLLAADANALFTTALTDVMRAATTDKDAFAQLRATVASITNSGDLDRASLDILRVLALTTEDGKNYLRHDDAAAPAPITMPLVAYIAIQAPLLADPLAQSRKTTLEGIARAIHDPHSATTDVPAAGAPLPTAAQLQAAEALVGRIKTMFPPGRTLPANADAATTAVSTQEATPAQMDALMAAINGAEPAVRDMVYAWRDKTSGQGVLQLLGTHLSPTQVETAIATLDPVERLFKQLSDQRGGDPYPPFHDFLALHLADATVRQRTLQHAPLIQQFYQSMPVPQQRVIMRMIISGREAPDAVDKLHEAADSGDSTAAISAIIELGGTPAKLQTLRADLIFVHRLQDKCNDRVPYQGMPVKPYDLFLRMCGVDANDTHEAGSLAKQTEINPSPTPEVPLNPAERAQLDTQLYQPFKEKLVDELNSWLYVSDSKVMGMLFDFQARAAQPDNVLLLRRAHEAPGPELAKRVQAGGCDIRLKIQRGLDGDNIIQAERILGFTTDQAAVGVIGGKGALATDYKGTDGKGVVPLPQALRETQVNGTEVLSQVIRDKAAEMDEALGKWFSKADKVKAVWRSYRAVVTDAVCADLRTKTGLPRVWPIELLSNDFLQVSGTSLQSRLKDKFDGEDEGPAVFTELGMNPADLDTRRQLAASDFKQQQDAAANAAAETAARQQVDAARQSEAFRTPSAELYRAFATLTPYVADDYLKGLGQQLAKGLQMAAIAAPPSAAVGPVVAPVLEHDPGARPGGPVHPGDGQPLDFKSFYKREHGIDPTRHAVEVAKAMAREDRTAAQIGQLFGVTAADLTAAPPAPPSSDALEITEANRTLVGPGFTIEKAESAATEIWDRLHGNGQIQFIRFQLDGHTQEEQRLIHIAFRRKSGGIDLQFYIEQHLEQQKAGAEDFAVSAGGGGADGKDARRLDIHGDEGETAEMLEVSQKGRVSLEARLSALVKANNMDAVYATIERATPDQRRAILTNNDLMGQLRAFGDDSYEWNRIYKSLSGESDMYDRLESRAHGAHGVIGGLFGGTDEKGMSVDIKAYAKQRREAITTEVCGDKPPTDAQKKIIADRLTAEFQSIAENPSVRAILQDELSGVEKSDREALVMNAGEDSHVSSALTEGDWTEDEEKILADIKKMSPAERKRCRENPEYINQLHLAIQSETTWRDAMIALASTEDGSKGENEDNYSALERASRSYRQDSTELVFEQDDVIQALAKLTQSEMQRLQADPRLQAQIQTALEGHPDQLAQARKMMAFDAAGAAAATGLQIGREADPKKGIYTRDQVDRVAFLKFSALNQLRAGSSRSWAMLLQAGTAVFQMKLKPSEGGEAPAAEPAIAQAPAGATPQATLASSTSAAAAKTAPAAAPHEPGSMMDIASSATAAAGAASDSASADAAFDKKMRGEIWAEAAPDVAAAATGWGEQDHTDATTRLKSKIGVLDQQKVIEKAVLHQEDPSPDILSESESWLKNDTDRIKDTLRKASDEELITQWTTIMNVSSSGTPSMKTVFDKWVAARAAAGGPSSPEHPRKPRVGSPEWNARTELKAFTIDTSRIFEETLLPAAGGWFGDTHATGDGEVAIRDNKEWLEWRSIIRDRIPTIEGSKIATALGASDAEAKGIINDSRLRDALSLLNSDTEKYLVARGEDSHYNVDRLTAGGEGLAEDDAFATYRSTVGESTLAAPGKEDAGEHYGQISDADQTRITEARARFNQSDTEFRAAKAAVANIAAMVVTLIITAAVTVLTAGTATGPVAVALLGALTAGAASTGANATKKVIQGTDFDFGQEGLKNIARDTVMGAVTAGTTFYASKLTSGLFAATSAVQQGALVEAVAANPSFLAGMGKTVVEQGLQNGMQGVFETGMAAFDPALWLDGWHEGWRRGSAAARDRASQIPSDMMHAAILAAMTHTVNFGAGKLYGHGGDLPPGADGAKDSVEDELDEEIEDKASKSTQAAEREEAELQHSELGTRGSFGDRAKAVGTSMIHGVSDGLIAGGTEIVLDEKTYRAEGLKLENLAGKLGTNAINMMTASATNVHATDANAVMRFRAGARELAFHSAGLSNHEQHLYADLAMKGEGSTVMSIAEFTQVRGEMVDKGSARYEAATGTALSAEQRAKFADYCREAPTFEEFRARAEGGPDKVPGEHLAAAPVASFETPVERGAELERADQLMASMVPVIDGAAGHRDGLVAMFPQRQALVVDAARALATIAPNSPQHAAAVDLISRVNQTSSELGNALDTATTGTSTLGVMRAELKLRLDAARQAKADPEVFAALHDAVLTASGQVATTPKAIEAAGPTAQKKLLELQALVDEAHALQDSAARSVGLAPIDPVAPAAPAAPAGKPDAPAVKPDAPVAKVDAPAVKPDEPAVKPDAPVAKPDAPAARPDAPAFDARALGSDFAGHTEAAPDPVRTHRAIDAAIAGGLPEGATANGNTVLLARGERETMFVHVEVATEDLSPLQPVAIASVDGRDQATIRVSPTASEAQIQRAVAGKLAELAHVVSERAAGRRADTTSALAEGSQARELSPQDYSQIAQLKTAIHQLDAAQARGDSAGADQIRRDAYSLAVGMGLLEANPAAAPHVGPGGKPMSADAVRITGAEASARRLQMIDGVLGADSSKLNALISGARADSAAVDGVRADRAAARERLRSKCQEMMAEREAANAALRPVIDAALGADGTGAIFERIIVGGGWAGAADFATMKHGAGGAGGVPPVLTISHGGDPWAGRGDLLMGQNPAELEMRGMAVQPGDLATDPHDFTKSGDFATAVGASAAAAGMPTYDASVSKVEHRPEDAKDWPDGARYRITAGDRSFYARTVDIVSGPGPARTPASGRRITDDASGYAIDASTGEYFENRAGIREDYVKVEDPSKIKQDIRDRLEAKRGTVSTTFVDQESGFSVDASKSPEVVKDKAGQVVSPDAVPDVIARRLGIQAGRQRGDGPALVDGEGRPQSSRVYDPESKLSVDMVGKKVYGQDGKEVLPSTLDTATRTRLGIDAAGQFTDPRWIPGPGGRSVNPVTGEVRDTQTGAAIDIKTLPESDATALRAMIEQHRVKFGGTLLADDYKPGADGKVPNVLVYGSGASGAWDIEQAIEGGARADWAGRLSLPNPKDYPEGSEQRADFTALASKDTPVEVQRALLKKYKDQITEETLKGGKNRRNSVPGLGAYSDEVQDGGNLKRSARTVVDIQQTTDGRFFVQFNDGTNGVYDKAIMSIGQDTTGVGGVGALTGGMALKGDRGVDGRIRGATDEDGGLRILGAAGMGPTIGRLSETDSIDAQIQAAKLPSDSRNIGVSIRGNAGAIADANQTDIGGDSALEAAKRDELRTQFPPEQADRLFRAWQLEQTSPKSVESKDNLNSVLMTVHDWADKATQTFVAAEGMQQRLNTRLGADRDSATEFAKRIALKHHMTPAAARQLVEDFRTAAFSRATSDVDTMSKLLVEHAQEPKNERHKIALPAPIDDFGGTSVMDASMQMSIIDDVLAKFDSASGSTVMAMAAVTPAADPPAAPGP